MATHLEHLEMKIGSLKHRQILDIGIGAGDFVLDCARAGYRVVGLDVAPHKLERIAQRAAQERLDVEAVLGAAEHAPFPDASFDVINASELIEHVQEPDRVLAEVRRLLRPGGVCYMSVHNRWGMRDAHFRLYFLNWMPRLGRSDTSRCADVIRSTMTVPVSSVSARCTISRGEVSSGCLAFADFKLTIRGIISLGVVGISLECLHIGRYFDPCTLIHFMSSCRR